MHSLDDEESTPLAPERTMGAQLLGEQIADLLRVQITNGDYAPGERLSGENVLIAAHGISRTTARAALRILHAEGLITVRRGAGSFVQRAESVSIPVADPKEAAAILRGRLDSQSLTALVAELGGGQ
jgi:DNA-binding GntR family transcriptional regulator